MKEAGYRFEVLPSVDREAMEEGLRYVNNDACYPCILVVGQMMNALHSGKYDLHKTALMITQTGGGCRATNYIALIRKALHDAKMDYIPVISVNLAGLESNPGFQLTPSLIKRVIMGVLYGDLLMRVLYRMRPYEREKGTANQLYEKWVKLCKYNLHTGSLSEFKRNVCGIIKEFDALETIDVVKPRVGLVGEILVKFHPTANNQIVDIIEKEGCLLYTSPFVNDANGEGVAWANSLFEDNAEFGYGMALAQNYKEARILKTMEDNMENVEPALKDAFAKYIEVHGDREAEREVAPTIKELAAKSDIADVKELAEEDLISKSVWIVGGDGWAYDIGYGGLDHVLANDLNVNVLVLDTEVYSNTGGQSSKSSQAASIAKFAAGGKTTAKKDLGQIAMAYGHVYVASISMGANKAQTLKAIKEAESYNGPSLILAYSPCAEHGIKGGLANHQKTQAKAVECGYLDLYRYDPRKETPLTIDSKEPDFDKMLDFMMSETRYSQLPKLKGETAYEMFEKTKKDAIKRHKRLLAIAKEDI